MWEKLNRHHANVSPHFKEAFRQFTFDERRERLLAKARTGKLRIDLARKCGEREYAGYCISSIDTDRQGEIESIFVEERRRGRGIGQALMQRALAWMDGKGVSQRSVAVAFGNEEAFRFYAKFGFYPRITRLRWKGKAP